MVSPEERKQLLDFITASDHDPASPPPGSSWELNCVDRPGDQATWGLRQEVVQRLQEEPPPALQALGRRLQVGLGCYYAMASGWSLPCLWTC
jgi:hypothetical protein